MTYFRELCTQRMPFDKQVAGAIYGWPRNYGDISVHLEERGNYGLW
jgi:hypothetical protein